ncbi:MAG: UMP kinase, partial [Candidatus Methanomethylophilaceae archaeon]|nr:UMP kinase [Candidatus Methanomethylophilaceae archaeon]
MDKVVISVGGSVLIPGNDDAKYIAELAKMLREASEQVQIAVVVGGGKMSRY